MKECCVEILKLLDEKGLLTTDLEYVHAIFSSGTIKKKKSKVPPAERQGKYDNTKCQARIWAEGYDSIQCQFSPISGCFCKRHNTCSEGKWWLGISMMKDLNVQYSILAQIQKVLNTNGKIQKRKLRKHKISNRTK